MSAQVRIRVVHLNDIYKGHPPYPDLNTIRRRVGRGDLPAVIESISRKYYLPVASVRVTENDSVDKLLSRTLVDVNTKHRVHTNIHIYRRNTRTNRGAFAFRKTSPGDILIYSGIPYLIEKNRFTSLKGLF